MVIGGQAVLFYGEPRFTKDIDITLGVGIEKLDDLIKIVTNLKLKILTDKPKDFVKELMVLPVAEEASGIRISFSSNELQV